MNTDFKDSIMSAISSFTQAILNIFYQLTTIPHGSFNTNEMAAFLESFAKSNDYANKKRFCWQYTCI